MGTRSQQQGDRDWPWSNPQATKGLWMGRLQIYPCRLFRDDEEEWVHLAHWTHVYLLNVPDH